MKFSTIAIEDEPYVLKDFLETLKLVPSIDVKASFHSVTEALSYLGQNGPVNIIFSDIEMPNLTGIEGGELLAQQCDLLVFTTGHAQFTKEAFGVGAKGYILKPVRVVDLLKITSYLNKVKMPSQTSTMTLPEYIEVRDIGDDASRKILLTRIMSLTTLANYVCVETKEGTYIRYDTLLNLEKQLAKTKAFVRVNRSTILSLAAVSSVKSDTITLINDTVHRMSRLRKAEFLRAFDEYYTNI